MENKKQFTASQTKVNASINRALERFDFQKEFNDLIIEIACSDRYSADDSIAINFAKIKPEVLYLCGIGVSEFNPDMMWINDLSTIIPAINLMNYIQTHGYTIRGKNKYEKAEFFKGFIQRNNAFGVEKETQFLKLDTDLCISLTAVHPFKMICLHEYDSDGSGGITVYYINGIRKGYHSAIVYHGNTDLSYIEYEPNVVNLICCMFANMIAKVLFGKEGEVVSV